MNSEYKINPLISLLALPAEEKQALGVNYTPHEIAQQPATWAKSYQDFVRCHAEIKEFLAASGIDVERRTKPTVFLVGAGTSDYIGKSLAALLRRSWQCEVLAVSSTDLLTNFDDWLLPHKPYLWISFSRSGDSAEGVAILEAALERHPHIRQLIVTCNAQGKMARAFAQEPNVYCFVLDEAVNDRGLAMTSSFSNMALIGQCLAHVAEPDKYETILSQMVTMGQKLLPQAAHTSAQLVDEGFSQACFLGSGALRGVAHEASLKVVELTAGKVAAISESFLGLRHGPLSALNRETLVVGFLSGDERRQAYELDLLTEIRNKGLCKTIVAIVPNELTVAVADHTLTLRGPAGFADDYRVPLDVIFGQLLGLFSSLHHGLQPDTPSPNGAICRVVTKVKIY